VDSDQLQELKRHLSFLTDRAVELQYQRQPGLWPPYGEVGLEKSRRDMGYHLTYLIEALQAQAPHLFIEYLHWVQELFASLQFPEDVVLVSLECLQQAMHELPQGGAEARPALELLAQARMQLIQEKRETPSYLTGDRPVDQLAREYLAALLRADRRAASQMILDAWRNGVSIKQLYREVFERTQREIGRLWQTNRISVAQEHYCTAATQMIMSQLYPYLFTGERKDRRAITCCVSGELHELGARMVSDYLEMEGWDSYFFGANTPLESLVRSVSDLKPHLVAISATMTFHVSRVAEVIRALRAEQGGESLRILVGGYAFNLAPDLWRTLGADGYAPDAEGAVALAENLVGR